MKAKFYRFRSNSHGFYIQRENCERETSVTKAELLKIADLRHPVLTAKEYLQTLMTDINGAEKPEFELLGSNHLIIVTK